MFQGREWVNATSEYYKLPPVLMLDTDRWVRRLRHIHITYCAPDCRTTKVGNIAEEEQSPRVPKDIYVLKTVWDAAMRKCQESGPKPRRKPRSALAHVPLSSGNNGEVQGPVAESDNASDTGPDDAAGCEFEKDDNHNSRGQSDPASDANAESGERERVYAKRCQVLPQIFLVDGEYFAHDGRRFDIKVYGERTMSGLYLDARDVAASIGMRFEHMPPAVAVEEATVGGQAIEVLPWHAFLHLAFLKAAKYPVANAISVWVSSTMFAVQFAGGAGVGTQAEFASRTSRFMPSTYISHLDSNDQIIYAIDAFPAQALEDAYPGTVAPASPDTNLSTCRVIKIGCGKRERIGAVRSELQSILPGHDPRPIFALRVPSVTDAELQNNFEKPIHVEFTDTRIGHEGRPSIPGLRNKYTELFVVTADMKELVVRTATVMVDRHNKALASASEKELDGARKDLQQLVEARMENKVHATKIQHLEAALEASDAATKKSDAAVEKVETALRRSEEECLRLRETIAQLLPRKMSALKTAFSRMTQ